MVSRSAPIELQQLRIFAEIARRNGLTAAADAIGIPKSSVSKALSALERNLGVKLVERSSRRIALTREGARLLPRAESILAEVEGLVDQADEDRDRPEGLVRIAATPEFGGLMAARLVPRILADHQRLKIAMRLDYMTEDLLDLRADFAFRIGTIGDERLVARRITAFRRVLVASPAFAAAHPVAVPADLETTDCIFFKDEAVSSEWTLEAADDAQQRHRAAVAGRMAVNGLTALTAVAEAGLGIGFIPDFVAAPSIEAGRLVRVLPGWQSAPTPVFVAHRVGIERIARVRAVIDQARRLVPTLLAEAAAPVYTLRPSAP